MLTMKAETTSTSSDTTAAFRKGAWSNEEDEKLRKAVDKYGLRNWVAVEKYSGLNRPAKNCRLRWLNYLRPNLKKHPFTPEEEELIFQLHSEYGNSWSRIASKLPGRSDNEIKNFWHKKSNKRHRTATSAPPSGQTTLLQNAQIYSPEQTSSFSAPQQFSFRQPQMHFSKLQLPTDSFSAFQLQSPNSAPLSPLKLRLSIPIPSEFCFGSNPSLPDLTSQLSPSSCCQNFQSHSIKKEPPLIQAESDSKPKIMKELRDAQARVRLLKKKLKLRRLRKKNSKTTNLAGSSSDSITKECTSHTNSGTKNLIDGISESHNHTEFGRDYSLGEIFKTEDSMNFHNQIGFSDHLNTSNTMNALYREDSALLQDNFIPVSNTFDPISRQTTANTPDDDISWSSYLQLDQGCYFGYNFEQEASDNLKMNSLPSQDMLDSSSFVSAPIMEQEYFRVEDFSFHQTPSEGNPNETNMLLHKSLSAPNLIENSVDFRYQPDFKQEYQNLPETCRELMEGLMVDNNLWAGVELMDSSYWNC